MLTQEEIDAFREDAEVVREFVRRSRKGLPEDRWTTGVDGARRLAKACDGLLGLVQIQADASAAMLSELHRIGLEAMEPSRDPCRG